MPQLKHDRSGISTAASQFSDPAALRAVFSRNLRKMTADVASIAGLCRTLGINRTQFNRYLSEKTFRARTCLRGYAGISMSMRGCCSSPSST